MVMNQPLRTQLEAVLDVENMTLLKSIESLKGQLVTRGAAPHRFAADAPPPSSSIEPFCFFAYISKLDRITHHRQASAANNNEYY